VRDADLLAAAKEIAWSEYELERETLDGAWQELPPQLRTAKSRLWADRLRAIQIAGFKITPVEAEP